MLVLAMYLTKKEEKILDGEMGLAYQKTMATDSTKQVFYGHGVLGVDVVFGTTEQAISAAITGRWK